MQPSFSPSGSPGKPFMAVMQADTQDSDIATAQTIGLMCNHIHAAARDPLVASTAVQAERQWGRPLVSRSIPLDPAGAGCFWWAKHAVKAVPHSQFKATVAAYPQKRQLLIVPGVVLRSPSPAGDCSTFSMLLAAMLESLGVAWELVTVAVEPSEPGLYSHVFVRAILDDGGRVTLDGSHGKYPGWEVPRSHQFRRQVWNMAGEPIDDAAPVISALGAYRPRRGLGDDGDDIGGSYTDSSSLPGAVGASTTDLSSLFTSEGLTMPTATASGGDYVMTGSDGSLFSGPTASGPWTLESTSPLPAGSSVAPAQNSASWAAFATAMGKAGMALAQINAIQPGTVVSANGAILRQSTGYSVPVGGVTANLGSSSTVMMLGLAVAAVFVFMLVANKSR